MSTLPQNPSSSLSQSPPAERLEGMTLSGGWHVTSRVTLPPGWTGGHNSVSYVVSHPSRADGFLKAIDLSQALASGDVLGNLHRLTQAFMFERDVCIACAKHALDHVVVAVDHGEVLVDPTDPHSKVFFIVFERADGDIRRRLDAEQPCDIGVRLRILHHVAVGLQQLHKIKVAHQDLKPSNVLRYEDQDKSKVADLGRASAQEATTPSPWDALLEPGDRGYEPPELRYGHASPNWNVRRVGNDLYLFGSFILFVFTRCNMSGVLFERVPADYRPERWRGGYSDVLPFLNDAFSRVLEDAKPQIPEEYQDELIEMIRQLCDPDPELRGHPQERRPGANPHSLERYITALDKLATRAAYLPRGSGA